MQIIKITLLTVFFLSFLISSFAQDQEKTQDAQERYSVMEEAISGSSNSSGTETFSTQLEDGLRKEILEDVQKLKQIGPQGAGLEKFGTYRHPNDMCEAIGDKWSKIGAPAVSVLVESLKSGDCYFYWLLYAVDICLKNVGKTAIPILTEAMNEAYESRNITFKVNLLSLLHNFIDDPAMVSILERTLKDEDLKVREATLQVFVRSSPEQLGHPAVVSLLIEALKDKDGSNRGVALFELGRINSFKQDPSSVDSLIKALDDSDWGVREQAAVVLGKMRANSAVPALIKKLNDRNDAIRYAVINALGGIGDPRATPGLIKILERGDFILEACLALGNAGDPTAIPALEKIASKLKVTPLTRLAYKMDHRLFPMGNSNPDYDVRELKDAATGAISSIKRRYNIEGD